jgi:hypothetical protein
MTDYRAIIEGWLLVALKEWRRQQMLNPYAALYLWGTKGAVVVAADSPGPEWSMVDNQRISPAWTGNQAFNHLRDKLYRFPLF